MIVILKFKDGLEKRAREHLKTGQPGKRGGSPLTHRTKAINVRKQLAELSGVGEGSMPRIEAIMKHADEETAAT